MLDFSKILLPLDLEEPSQPAVHEAAALARRFHSTVLLLHVVRPWSYLGLHELRHGEVLSEGIKQAEAKLDATILRELAGNSASHMVVKGDPGHSIVQVARDQNVKVIVMATHGYGALASALVGSVTSKVLDGAQCPVWTGPHMQLNIADLMIRNVLCAVDFQDRDAATARLAATVAEAFGARLILAHVTPSVENYGPGGSHVLPDFKEALYSAATKQLTKLREDTGIKAEFFIGSGKISKILNQAAKETEADLLVVGRRLSNNRLGAHSFAIVRDSQIPVLSV